MDDRVGGEAGADERLEDGDSVIGPHEAARLLRVGPSTIQRWLDSGALVGYRTEGGHRRIFLGNLVRFAHARGMPLFRTSDHAWPMPTVLIVDDEEDVLETLRIRIEGCRPDARVYLATDGFQAGYRLREARPDLVLLDIRMPGMSGVEVCRTLRDGTTFNRPEVVGMTAHRDELSIRALLDAGAREVIFKPLNMQLVASILRRYLPAPVAAAEIRSPAPLRALLPEREEGRT